MVREPSIPVLAPVKLIYVEGFASKEEAMSAEALLKRKKRPQKERFLSENQEKI